VRLAHWPQGGAMVGRKTWRAHAVRSCSPCGLCLDLVPMPSPRPCWRRCGC